MPRQARKTSGTGIYDVMLRGINRQNRSENRPLIYPLIYDIAITRYKKGFNDLEILVMTPAEFVQKARE